jgi:23S rRNA pseudouridine1911/1915/1917 synthase
MESSPRAPKKVDRHPHPDWQECILEILSQEKMIDESILLKIQLQTGRTHQIRAQLGFEQCPIIGDQAYGAPKVFNDDKIELQACELQFSNPLTQEQHHFLIKDF